MEILDRILPTVEKPARYTGNELNMVIKDKPEIRFALCFPDIYEVGMSHLGSRILYHLLNSREDTYCERAYAPWVDMEQKMRENGIPLFSLETKTPLKEFDVIGFSLLHEMCYTNVLNMLELSGLPLLAQDRGEESPLIICGGPCVCNAEPLADFFDVALFGDGEEILLEFMDVFSAWKKRTGAKKELLLELSKIQGVYVPSFYRDEYDGAGHFKSLVKIESTAPDRIERRVVKDLDKAFFPEELLLPYIEIIHDRVTLEIFRGCTRGCRFCQAGYIYRPVRERTNKTLIKQARGLVECTGYDEISLLSLSSGDYCELGALIPDLINEFKKEHVSISLPSLRIDSFLKDYAEQLQRVRKTGLTFAPEAGTQQLRDVINKGVTEQDLIRSVRDAFDSGWNGVKLYFMIGLPTETNEDLDGIADLARKVSQVFYSMPKEKRGKGLRLVVSTSSFVPKPFTPFQWERQSSVNELIEKQMYLKAALKGIRGVEFNYNKPNTSFLEAVFARGDRRLKDVLLAAHQKGCRFDSWGEHFKFDAWMSAFEECGIDPADIANRERTDNEPLPWDHMDALIDKKYLLQERSRAKAAAVTRDCRKGCNGCFNKNSYENYCSV